VARSRAIPRRLSSLRTSLSVPAPASGLRSPVRVRASASVFKRDRAHRARAHESGESYEPLFGRRTGGVGTDQLEKVWPRSQRYSRYRPNIRALPVGDAGAPQMVQRLPLVLICAPYSRRPERRRAIQVALKAEASAGRSE
jgi:hypothetical protein